MLRLRRDLDVNLPGAAIIVDLVERLRRAGGRSWPVEAPSRQPHQTSRRQRMDPNRLTEKAQEAIRQAQNLAQRQGQSQIDAEHLAVALLGQDGGVAARVVEKAGAQPASADAAPPAGARPAAPRVGPGRASGPGVHLAPRERGPERRRGRGAAHEGRVRERRAPAPGARRPQGRRRWPRRSAPPASPREAARGAGRRARRPARDEPDARGHLRGAREVRARPHRARPAGQARPGHRPRRGDPPRRSRSSRAAPRTTRC